MVYIRIAFMLLALAIGGWMGYRWGSGDLAKVRAEIVAINQTGQAAQADSEATQKRIDEQLKLLADEHATRLKELTSGFEAQKLELSGNLDRANARIAALGSQRQSVAAQLDQTRKEMATATGAQREALRLKEQQLAELDAKLQSRQEGIRCETVAVPESELATLNSVLGQP
jgi:chromosome segregation ATPase